MPYSVRRITCVRPRRLVALGGNGASRREGEGVERTGRTVLAYVRGGAGVGRSSVCQSHPPGASEADQKPVVSPCSVGMSIVVGRVVARAGSR